MLNRLLTALFCVLIFAVPSHAGQSPRGFLKVAQASMHGGREALFMGKPVSKRQVEKAFRGSNAVSIAKRYLGTNPTGWNRLWCARWLNMVEQKAGRKGTGSNFAKSFARYGKPVSLANARPGDIVVTGRKGGGHVGYLVTKNGKTVTLISGNSGGRGPGRRVVAQGNYPVSRIIAVRRPV